MNKKQIIQEANRFISKNKIVETEDVKMLRNWLVSRQIAALAEVEELKETVIELKHRNTRLNENPNNDMSNVFNTLFRHK
jgi:hypothetical protein